jgi:hypothetical protein
MAASTAGSSGADQATLVAAPKKEKPPVMPAVLKDSNPNFLRPYNDRPNEKAEPNNKKEQNCLKKN